MQAFWTAFAQFFATLTTLFGALEKTAATVDNLAAVGQLKSATYLKEAEHDQEVAVDEFAFAREQRRAAIEAKRKALHAAAATATTGGKAGKALPAPANP